MPTSIISWNIRNFSPILRPKFPHGNGLTHTLRIDAVVATLSRERADLVVILEAGADAERVADQLVQRCTPSIAYRRFVFPTLDPPPEEDQLEYYILLVRDDWGDRVGNIRRLDGGHTTQTHDFRDAAAWTINGLGIQLGAIHSPSPSTDRGARVWAIGHVVQQLPLEDGTLPPTLLMGDFNFEAGELGNLAEGMGELAGATHLGPLAPDGQAAKTTLRTFKKTLPQDTVAGTESQPYDQFWSWGLPADQQGTSVVLDPEVPAFALPGLRQSLVDEFDRVKGWLRDIRINDRRSSRHLVSDGTLQQIKAIFVECDTKRQQLDTWMYQIPATHPDERTVALDIRQILDDIDRHLRNGLGLVTTGIQPGIQISKIKGATLLKKLKSFKTTLDLGRLSLERLVNQTLATDPILRLAVYEHGISDHKPIRIDLPHTPT